MQDTTRQNKNDITGRGKTAQTVDKTRQNKTKRDALRQDKASKRRDDRNKKKEKKRK